MIQEHFTTRRVLKRQELSSDFVIVGGGLAGVCAAITAARSGLKVTLVQDRPVLGGNASSEVRLWILGATSHMGNNNRWAREGGIVDEILVENTYCNPEGNPLIFDMILLDKVKKEENIHLLLNTAVHSLEKNGERIIASINAFCSQNSTEYRLVAPLFCDASGDGIIGFLSGASFRMGAESMEEFGEKFAPTKSYGELLGHSMYFYSKDTGKPTRFIPPAFALSDITQIPRFRSFNTNDFGCKLWWLEWGGRLDTVHDTEEIKWELWKVIYGAWNHIKNSGEFPEAANLALEWVGTIPGKRESRRFMGDYMMVQQDLVEQRTHEDAVAYGGWSIDLHPADGVFSEKPGCNQWHTKGVYQIPYRTMYSRDISNLFLAGRILSASHVAFASMRVMATVAHAAQAVALAAKICHDEHLYPAEVYRRGHIKLLQTRLLRNGQYIPGLVLRDPEDLVQDATIQASSELCLRELPESGALRTLDLSLAQMLPLQNGPVPKMIFHAQSGEHTELEVELRMGARAGCFTPEKLVAKKTIAIHPGRNCIHLEFDAVLDRSDYVFVTFYKNPKVQLHLSAKRVTGILSVFNLVNKAVSNNGKQTPLEDIGVHEFEFWCPKRRPEGGNVALKIANGIKTFGAANIASGIDRPVSGPNAWVADFEDRQPELLIRWEKRQRIKKIDLFFDTDYDHPMESVLMSHPETVMPFCVRNYTVEGEDGQVLYCRKDNYQSRNTIEFETAVETSVIKIMVEHPSPGVPAAIFAIRCYADK